MATPTAAQSTAAANYANYVDNAYGITCQVFDAATFALDVVLPSNSYAVAQNLARIAYDDAHSTNDQHGIDDKFSDLIHAVVTDKDAALAFQAVCDAIVYA